MVIYNRDDKELTIPVGWGAIIDEPNDYSAIHMGAKILDGEGYFLVKKSNLEPSVPDRELYYSINNGEWRIIDNINPENHIAVKQGDVVRFKGYNDYYGWNEQNGTNILFSGVTWEVRGNIMSLCYGDDFSGITEHKLGYSQATAPELFEYNVGLVSAENLILPILDLNDGDWGGMFTGCRNLEKAPYLPAVSAKWASYSYMFNRCGKIKEIRCALTEGMGFPSTDRWLQGVSETGVFYRPAGVEWDRGDSGIPEGWEIKNL